ncbi:MAG: hypothetical protein A2117_01845 [Candidatus Wildermuthbacteria bacterium GWA2_46_15]|uniref:Uncharacterized protein n=1 Tax=Candidatus Wildermuthbacteria bacterium GWA2_46_15 TaxID=1802443 RepID=A0A1G2QPS3_9BACT|nr:MAG: hypothetical protein A2117_01845 [Candidatus Wildermuthbacteria bacterium GWA2_46_15]
MRRDDFRWHPFLFPLPPSQLRKDIVHGPSLKNFLKKQADEFAKLFLCVFLRCAGSRDIKRGRIGDKPPALFCNENREVKGNVFLHTRSV